MKELDKKAQKFQDEINSKLNGYGNVEKLPENWKTVPTNANTLKSAGIPFAKCLTGWEKNGRFSKPILENIIPDCYEEQLENHLNSRKPRKVRTEEEKELSWCKRLAKLTGIELEEAKKIMEAKKNAKQKQISELEKRQIEFGYSTKRHQLINKIENSNPLRRIENKAHALYILDAHHRHANTNYDEMLEEARNQAEMGEIDRGDVKMWARKNYC